MTVREPRIISIVCGLFVILAGAVAQSATLTVRRDGSGDFATIQPALDAASPGDTIDIGPGEYTEFQTIRPPNWNWDLEIYAYITVDNLTIVGAGADQTLIGPLTPQYDYNLFTPKCIYAGNVANLHIRNLTARNCYGGIYGPTATLVVLDSHAEGNRIGISVYSSTVDIERCMMTGVGSAPRGIRHTENCVHSVIRDCVFVNSELYFSSVDDFVAENCRFSGGRVGIGIYFECNGIVDSCDIACDFLGVEISHGSTCEVRQTRISGGTMGLYIEGGQTSVTATAVVIESTIGAAVRLFGPGAFSIRNSDLLPASGFAAEMYEYNTPPSQTYDFTGNYWGVTESSAIEALIWDAHDSSVIDDYIDFTGFAGHSVPTESTTWGAVKSLFR